MKNEIINICDNVIKNYRYCTQNLRYDGDYINHFCALINGYKNNIISDEKVLKIKSIRTLIKDKTDIMSPFRGDILYIISILIADEDISYEEFIDDLLLTFNMLVEYGFNECGHLILAAYSITKYCESDKRDIICKRMKNIFYIMKSKYGTCTKQDDYLSCALIAIEGMEYNNVTEYMNNISEYIKNIDFLNNNEIQNLTNSIIIDNKKDNLQNIFNLLMKCGDEDLKVGRQFLHLMTVFNKEHKNDCIIDNMKKVLNYLSYEESEYYYYIDKDFRNMISLVIVFASQNTSEKQYFDELIAFGVYCFLVSKNKGILNEVFA